MVYQFGPDEQLLFALGGGETLGIANPVLILVGLTLVFGFLLNFTVWGRHIYAVGGNPQAARLTGLAVERIKVSAYLLSALTAGIAAILTIGWLGSVTNALGLTYELRVIAASVIGGLATPAAAQTKQYTFALVPKAMNNPFFDLARDGCMKAAEDLKVKCLYIGPGEHTETEQVQIVQDLISRGVDGIAVSP